MKKRPALIGGIAVAVFGLAALLAIPGSASATSIARPTSTALSTPIALPNGFGPESIVAGPGPFAYLGSRFDGSIYRINLLTGQGTTISPATGTPSWGVKTDDRGRLFVAGGTNGDARVIDARTGAVLARYQLTTIPAVINDVVLTPTAAYFTDSANPVLYKLPLGPDGSLPPASAVKAIPLTGDIVYGAGFNANGITLTPDGRGLIIVQTSTGLLFRVDPATGVTTTIGLGAGNVVHGDGMILQGQTLYVVQNILNEVAVVHLNEAASAGQVLERLTDPGFDTPSAITAFGGRLYLPNARFFADETPATPYTVVSIQQP